MQKVCRGGDLLRPAECGCSIEILGEFGCICVFGCRGRCQHRPGRMHRFCGNLRRIRNFPTGRCGHRPLQDAARICGFPSGRASLLPTALGSGILAVILLHSPEFSLREHTLKPKRQIQVVRNRILPVDVQRRALPGRQNLVFCAVDHLARIAPSAVFVPCVDEHKPQIISCGRRDARHADDFSHPPG